MKELLHFQIIVKPVISVYILIHSFVVESTPFVAPYIINLFSLIEIEIKSLCQKVTQVAPNGDTFHIYFILSLICEFKFS